jgi:hypothetical protein
MVGILLAANWHTFKMQSLLATSVADWHYCALNWILPFSAMAPKFGVMEQ